MRPWIRYWRGALVIVFWIVWPPVFFTAELIAHLERSTGRGCSLEGCSTPLGPIDLFAIIPPAVVTVLWWRWRKRRPSAGTHHDRAV